MDQCWFNVGQLHARSRNFQGRRPTDKHRWVSEYCFTSLSVQSLQYRDKRKPEAGTMPYFYFEWLQEFFIVYNAISSTIPSMFWTGWSTVHIYAQPRWQISGPIAIWTWYLQQWFNPLTAKIIQFEFSPTWSCVSLTRSTTLSEWKLFRFDKIEVNSFQILLVIDATFYL